MAMKILIACCLLVSACASRSDRVVTLAEQGLGWDATYHPSMGGDIRVLKFLEQRAAWLGVSVEYRPEGHEDLRGATGLSWSNGLQKHVLVNGDLPINGRLEVLAHEIGHTYQPPLANRMEHEVFAELVSVEVCKRLGLDTARVAARYLQANKSALALARTHRKEIAFVADLLTRGYTK